MKTMRILLIAAVLVLATSFSTSSMASDPSDAKASHAAGAAEHNVELLHWDAGAALWSIAVFVILLIILRIAAWKPILAGLHQRENFIRDSLAKAKHEREAAEKLLVDYKAKIEHAHQEATAIVEEGRRDSEEARKRLHGEAKVEAEAIVARAKKDIELARDEAVKKLHDQSIHLATAVAGKLIRRELTAADQQSLLNESLAELSKLN